MVSGVLKTWCAQRNAASKLKRWYGAALVLLLAGVGLFGIWRPLYAILFILAAYVLARLAPKGDSPAQYKDGNRYEFVPDELLTMLAEATTLPTALKADIAKLLNDEGRVMFDDLFALENAYLHQQTKEQCAKGPGFRKMMAFLGQSYE